MMGAFTKKTGVHYLVNAALVLLLFFVLLIFINNGVISRTSTGILTLVCINITLAVSLNLVTGILGQLVLGHAGFMLVGAYTAALFTKNSGLDLEIAFPIGLVLAGIAAALFGIVIGIPALRLRGDYLAIITLGFGEIIRVIANNLKITNGAMGLSDIKSLSSLKTPARCLYIRTRLRRWSSLSCSPLPAPATVRGNRNPRGRNRGRSHGYQHNLFQAVRFRAGSIHRRRGRRGIRSSDRDYRPVQIRFRPFGRNPDNGGARRHGLNHRLDNLGDRADMVARTAQGLFAIPLACLLDNPYNCNAVQTVRPARQV